MKGVILLLLIITCPISRCIGQQSDYIYTNYTVSDGLPSNECHTIIQDSKGYIWVGTDNGVSRFDGYSFKQYDSKEGLGDMVIFNLQEDSDGRIWAGGIQNKLFIYDPEIDLFSEYKYNSLIADATKFSAQFANKFTVENGALFFSILDLGVVEIDKTGNLEIHYLCNQSAYFLFQNTQNPLILYGAKTAVKSRHKLEIEFSNETSKCNDNKFSEVMTPESQNYTKCGMIKNGATKYLFIGSEILETNDSSILWKRREAHVNKIQKDKNGNVVLSFDSDLGCKIYSNLKNNKFEYIINGISVTSFLEDIDGGYWVTSIDQGLFYIKNRNIKYINEHHNQGYYTHLIQDGKGNLFSASFGGSLERVNIESKFNDIINFEKGNDYQSLAYDNHNDQIWYSNTKKTIVARGESFEDKSQVLTSQYPTGFISTEFYFGQESVISLKSNRDLQIHDYAGEELYFGYYNIFGKYMPYRSRSLLQKGDSILIGSYGGLFVFHSDSITQMGSINSLLDIRIDEIQKDNLGNILLATKGNGLVIIPSEGESYNISSEDGLLTDYLEGLTLGEDGIVWVASLKGINRVDINDQNKISVQSISVDQGLPVPDVYDLEWYQNTLYAATGNGVVEITPFDKQETSVNPRIEFLEVNQQKYNPQEKHIFTHTENNVKLSFSTIDFSQNGKIIYRYKINNGSWNETKERVVSLVDLAPNKYTINIQSRNRDAIWSSSSTVKFDIEVPWWSNKWLYVLFSLAVIGSIIYFFRSREKKIIKDNNVKQELRSLEKAALQSQMNPHFIFNSLNSIQNFIMSNDKMAAMDYLGRFAKLIRLTLNASAKESIPLHDEIQMLKYYLSLEKLRFKSKFDYKIIVGDDVDVLNTYLPPMLIQPLAENAVKHGMNGVDEGGVIEVRVCKKDARLHILIRDNGPELEMHKIPNTAQTSEESKMHRSLGMRITGKRLNMEEEIEVKRVGGWTEVEVWV